MQISLCHLMGINTDMLSKNESLILEADVFTRICGILKEIFKMQYKNYFRIMKFNSDLEDEIMESEVVRCIINDILSTEEYSLAGIAYYTNMPEDVIYEVAIGKNTDPSSSLLRKIVVLHRLVRPDLYQMLMGKMVTEYHVSPLQKSRNSKNLY